LRKLLVLVAQRGMSRRRWQITCPVNQVE
jgi:hypothetical protein